MKKVVCYSELLMSLLMVVMATQAVNGAEPVELASTITGVTVFADRARVNRQADTELKAGFQEVTFSKLPGWVDEDSVRLALQPAKAGKIMDVRIERSYLAKADDEDIVKAQRAVQEITDHIEVLNDELKILEAQRVQVEGVRAFSSEQLPKDTLTRGVDAQGFDAMVSYVSSTLRETASRRRKTLQEKRELEPELSARNKRLQELNAQSQLEQCSVIVSIDAAEAVKAQLGLTYLLPGATWEPVHELRALNDSPEEVSIMSYAVISQTSGEDWDNVDIAFSTQSPSEIMHIPELQALMLGTRPGARPFQNASKVSSFGKAQAIYSSQNGFYFNYQNPDLDEQRLYIGNNLRMNTTQDRITTTFEELQERGTTAIFEGVGKPMVRSDGRLVRVPIGSAKLNAKPQIVAVPDASLNAVNTVELSNTGGQPLLPGTVALYREGSFLGNTDMEFVSEGETFSLLLGVADRVKLSRVLDRKRSSLVRGQRTRMEVAFVLTVENLDDQPVNLQLNDRIPVSQDKEVRITKVDIEPKIEPDSQGMLMWNVRLAPGEMREHVIRYTLEYPQQAIAQQMEESQNLPRGQARPAAIDLYLQIDALENKF